jgi:hypothetical protein
MKVNQTFNRRLNMFATLLALVVVNAPAPEPAISIVKAFPKITMADVYGAIDMQLLERHEQCNPGDKMDAPTKSAHVQVMVETLCKMGKDCRLSPHHITVEMLRTCSDAIVNQSCEDEEDGHFPSACVTVFDNSPHGRKALSAQTL